jgi:type IV fimbrial biogenesis protein FimT
MRRCNRPSLGITLIELLIGVTVMAILMRLASPAMSGVMDSFRLAAASNTFLSALHLTRSEAIKRNSRVVLCKSATGASCAADGGWGQGWVVFHDANNNAALDSGEEVIRRESALPSHFSMTGNTPVAKYVSYTALGTPKSSAGAFQAGTITLCRQSASSADTRQIILSSTGRPRIERATVSACPT